MNKKVFFEVEFEYYNLSDDAIFTDGMPGDSNSVTDIGNDEVDIDKDE